MTNVKFAKGTGVLNSQEFVPPQSMGQDPMAGTFSFSTPIRFYSNSSVILIFKRCFCILLSRNGNSKFGTGRPPPQVMYHQAPLTYMDFQQSPANFEPYSFFNANDKVERYLFKICFHFERNFCESSSRFHVFQKCLGGIMTISSPVIRSCNA
jgi:hypothetical protein